MSPIVFALKYPSENSLSEVLAVAFARCESAGLTSLLSETLPNIISGEYESPVRSAPWYRHPTTVKLKQFYATLRVRTFCGPASHWTELMLFQESGFLGFSEPDIDTKLRMFWDTFTWDILNSSPSAPPRLLIQYVKLIRPFLFSSSYLQPIC